jgi:hypothetical protein
MDVESFFIGAFLGILTGFGMGYSEKHFKRLRNK